MREIRLESDPLHRFTPRTLLILGSIVTVFVGGFLYSAIGSAWIGATVFGVLAIATGAAVAALSAANRLTNERANMRWIEAEEEIVRAEKVEQLGHTAGGVSMAVDSSGRGALSDPEREA